MNILIKLMSIVSLVIAPTLAAIFETREGEGHIEKQPIKKEIIVSKANKGLEVIVAPVSGKPVE
jgi:hypothetical protein